MAQHIFVGYPHNDSFLAVLPQECEIGDVIAVDKHVTGELVRVEPVRVGVLALTIRDEIGGGEQTYRRSTRAATIAMIRQHDADEPASA